MVKGTSVMPALVTSCHVSCKHCSVGRNTLYVRKKKQNQKKNSEVPQYDMLNITTVLFKLKPEQNTKYLLIF